MRAGPRLLLSSSFRIPPNKAHHFCGKITISTTAPSDQPDLHPTPTVDKPPPSYDDHSLDAQIRSLFQQGHIHTALLRLQDLSSPASHTVYISLLKACHRRRSSLCTFGLLGHLYVHSLEFAGFLGEHSVVALVKCGALNDALHVFLRLPSCTAFAGTAIISGFSDNGCYKEALQMFVFMQVENIKPDPYTFVSLLKACGNIKNLEIGRDLHAMARKTDFALDLHLVTTLISMYGKCGAIEDAENVFVGVPHTDIVLFNSLMSAYIESFQAESALQLYRQMLVEGLCPDHQTFIIAVQACGALTTKEGSTSHVGDILLSKQILLEIGQALEVDAQSKGFNTDVSLIATLMSIHGKCGAFHEAEIAFSKLCSPGVVPCTAMLSAYVKGGEKVKAFMLYRQMQREDILPNQQTLVCILSACALFTDKGGITCGKAHSMKKMSLDLVKAIHKDAHRRGQASDLFVSNALISVYGKCEAIKEAQNVFSKLVQPDVVSWTSMLSIFVDMGCGHMALQSYRQMQKEGWEPNGYTYVMALQACGIVLEEEISYDGNDEHSAKALSLQIVRALHVDVEKSGLATDVFVATTLLTTYGKCGSLVEAKLFFHSLLDHNIVLSNAMLSTFLDHNQWQKALEMYLELQNRKFIPDVCTLICLLKACSGIGAVDPCWKTHFTIISAGLELQDLLASALIHTYGRNTRMQDAEVVANGLPQPSIVSWNACISGYAGEGRCIESLQLFEQLQQAAYEPNGVSFTSLLSACSHVGLTEQGFSYFDFLSGHCGLTPELQHYGSIVDLLGRAGDFRKVENMFHKMLLPADANFWSSLLASCSTHGNVGLGKLSFSHMLDLQLHELATYVLMSNTSLDWHDHVEAEDYQRGIT